jgi:hypothetical protein
MTAARRYQVECWGFTALVCVGLVLLAAEQVKAKAKGLLR